MTGPAPATSTAGGLTIAGFVISIVALLLSFIGGGFIPGVVAIVLLAIAGRRGRTSLGVAGSVMAVIAIVFSIVIVAVRVMSTGSGTL